jgi:hypothetical protein
MSEHMDRVRVLASHYETVLGLYRELEEISAGIFEAFGRPGGMEVLPEALRRKLAVVEHIRDESKAIAELKGDINLSGAEREHVRHAESELTEVVRRVVESEDRSRSLMQQQGVRINRI